MTQKQTDIMKIVSAVGVIVTIIFTLYSISSGRIDAVEIQCKANTENIVKLRESSKATQESIKGIEKSINKIDENLEWLRRQVWVYKGDGKK